MAKKLKVNKGVCIGCGACSAAYPNAFAFDDDGLAVCIGELDDATAETAKGDCPVGAIED